MDIEVGQLLSNQKLIFLNSKDSIKKSIDTFTKNQVHAIPLFDDKQQDFVRFVDILDLVVHIFLIYVENEIIEGNVFRLLEEEKRYVINEIQFENSEIFATIDSKKTLKEAIEFMNEKTIHRVGISDLGKLNYVLSCSAIINYIFEKNILPSEVMSRKISDENLGQKEVFKVQSHEQTSAAFKLMKLKGINGVAIVDKDGNYVGQLSSSDLKGIHLDTSFMEKMRKPLGEFVDPNNKVVSVNPNATIGEVLSLFSTTKKHRVFVFDQSKLVGIISQLDLIKCISKHI